MYEVYFNILTAVHCNVHHASMSMVNTKSMATWQLIQTFVGGYRHDSFYSFVCVWVWASEMQCPVSTTLINIQYTSLTTLLALMHIRLKINDELNDELPTNWLNWRVSSDFWKRNCNKYNDDELMFRSLSLSLPFIFRPSTPKIVNWWFANLCEIKSNKFLINK